MPKEISGYLNMLSQIEEHLVNKTEIICLAEFSQDPPQWRTFSKHLAFNTVKDADLY